MPQEQISKNLVYSDAPRLSRDSSLTEGINCDQETVSILQSENSYLKAKIEKLESENASFKPDICKNARE